MCRQTFLNVSFPRSRSDFLNYGNGVSSQSPEMRAGVSPASWLNLTMDDDDDDDDDVAGSLSL